MPSVATSTSSTAATSYVALICASSDSRSRSDRRHRDFGRPNAMGQVQAVARWPHTRINRPWLARPCSSQPPRDSTHGLRQRRVAHAHLRERAREALRQAFRDVHGAVLAAGAADCDREVTARALAVDGNARLQEGRDVLDVAAHPWLLLQESNDRRIAAIERAERLVPVGIG